MAKKGGSRGKSERLQYQYAYRVDNRLYPTKEEKLEAIRKAKTQFLRTGNSTVRGVKIIVRWRNPDNRNPRHANWKTSEDPGQSLFEVWETLGKGRGALR